MLSRSQAASFVIPWAVLLAWFLLPALPVRAHANLARSDPPTGAVLARAPRSVTLEFTEDLDERLSGARLVDADFQDIPTGPGVIDPAAPRELSLPLPALPNGAYTILWQVRSAVDGHVTNGSVAFSVGMATSPASPLPPAGARGPASAPPAPVEALLRWTSYLAASLAVGSLIFGRFVWRPAYRAAETPTAASDLQAARRLRRLATTGAVILLFTNLLMLLFQAWEASRGVSQIPFGLAILRLLDPRSGWLFWVRLAFLAALAWQARRLGGPGHGPSRPWTLALIAGLGGLLTTSLESHGAALGSPLAVAADWLHLAATAAWVGGLLPLFLSVRAGGLPAHRLVPRFSRLALASVAALALTGLYSAFLHVQTLEALAGTLYGRAVIAKIALFAFLIGLGAVNLIWLTPRLADPLGSAVRRLMATVRIEMALGLTVLLAAGLLTSLAPAREALLAERRLGRVGDYRENGVDLRLWVAPGKAGDNEIAVDVSGLAAGEGQGQPAVLLRLKMAEHEMGATQVETKAGESGRFSARGSYLAMAGDWEIEVILRQAGRNDIRHTFLVQVEKNPQESTLPNPVPADAASIASGQALYQEYCLACHGPRGKGDGPAGLAMNPRPADLSLHAVPGVHTDGQLFEWISNGYPGSVMPAFAGALTEEQRWHLVNFLRTLTP
jgi:copper transport protein